MYWIDTPEGHHCTRHDYAFPRNEVCHACVTDPGDPPTGVVDDPEYQKALRARISEYRANSRTARRKSDELYDKDEWSVAAKYDDTAVKWSRLAEERQEVLDRRQHNLDLIRHEEAMSGQRGARN